MTQQDFSDQPQHKMHRITSRFGYKKKTHTTVGCYCCTILYQYNLVHTRQQHCAIQLYDKKNEISLIYICFHKHEIKHNQLHSNSSVESMCRDYQMKYSTVQTKTRHCPQCFCHTLQYVTEHLWGRHKLFTRPLESHMKVFHTSIQN